MTSPAGTVTFLFTDIEGSTRLWEQNEVAMRAALARHDELLRKVVANHQGTIFSVMGDGMAAAFPSALDAVKAALAAQRSLDTEIWPTATPIRVRMGIHSGEVEVSDGEYLGTVVNRAARLMTIGHGGQVLCSSATTELLSGTDVVLMDLGDKRLRDVDRPMRVFQLRADGLQLEFPPLRALDAGLGNLPTQATGLIGRDKEVAEVLRLVRASRLVTLTGVGGVGKTRLALQVAAEMVGEFPDGLWFVELGPVGDPGAVPDAVATALGVTPQAGFSVADSVAEALSGRRQLVVVDNCEHVLHAAADVVETILARTQAVKVIATSREGLRIGAEHLCVVPPLGVAEGANSPAVELFVERARAAVADFCLRDENDVVVVTEICRRLDGIALSIELAAARMVSMSPVEVRDRLDDRFRLLSGSGRGLERHQTLRHAVAWSYDLLHDDERQVLNCAAVFAGGFDLAAAIPVCGNVGLDEYGVLDVLDSLVRKSLVTTERVSGHTRYGLLETIRQFAEERLFATGSISEVRDRHSAYFSEQAVEHFRLATGSRQRVATDWVDVEFANLRAGFRWAVDQAGLVTAAVIAAHAAVMAFPLQRFEPAQWSEELLEAATAADLVLLPRLYTAASLCLFEGRHEDALRYAQTAVRLESDPRYDPFEYCYSSSREATAYALAGQVDRCLEINFALAAQPGAARIWGLCGLLSNLPTVGRGDEAMAIAESTLAEARAHGNPFLIAYALAGYGRAITQVDPARALRTFREGLNFAQEERMPFWEGPFAQDSAGLEAIFGDLEQALHLVGIAIDSFQRAGNVTNLAEVLATLAILFDRLDQHDAAATIYGAGTNYPHVHDVINLPGAVEHLRTTLGQKSFDERVAAGAAMQLTDAVVYARHHIQLSRDRVPGAG